MYPKNAASPERIAIGAVIQISDGAVQTSGCTVRIIPIGVAEGDGAGTTAYSTDGVVLYTPTQAETNYTSFILIAKKTGCIPASVTVVTTAASTAGKASLDTDQAVNATKIGGTTQTGLDLGGNWTAARALKVDNLDATITSRHASGAAVAKSPATLAAADVSGNLPADIQTIKTQAVTCAAGVTFGVYVGGTGACAIASTALSNATWTDAKAGYLDVALSTIAGYIDTEIGAIITAVGTTLNNHLLDIKGTGFIKDTHSLPQCLTATGFSTLDAAGVRSAVGLGAANLDTQLADIPTVSEMNARTLVSASYATSAVCTETRLAELDAANLPADVAAVKSDTAATLADTGTDGVVVAAASKTGYKLASDGVDLIVPETGMNLRQAIAVIAAACAGKLSGAATTTITIKAAEEGTTTRISATVDEDGNRSAVTLTLPA